MASGVNVGANLGRVRVGVIVGVTTLAVPPQARLMIATRIAKLKIDLACLLCIESLLQLISYMYLL